MRLLILAALLFNYVLALEISKENLGCNLKKKFMRKGFIQGNNFRFEKISKLESVQAVFKECSGSFRNDCLYFYNVTSCFQEYLYPKRKTYSWNTELVRSQWVCSQRFHPKTLKEVKTRKEIEVFGQYVRCVFQELGVYDYILDAFNEDAFPAGHKSKYIELYIRILKECKQGLGDLYNFQFFYNLLKCADISSVFRYF